jgi:hypothetical protein
MQDSDSKFPTSFSKAAHSELVERTRNRIAECREAHRQLKKVEREDRNKLQAFEIQNVLIHAPKFKLEPHIKWEKDLLELNQILLAYLIVADLWR